MKHYVCEHREHLASVPPSLSMVPRFEGYADGRGRGRSVQRFFIIVIVILTHSPISCDVEHY